MLIYNGLDIISADCFPDYQWTAPSMKSLDIATDLYLEDKQFQVHNLFEIISCCHFIDATGIRVVNNLDSTAPLVQIKKMLIPIPFSSVWVDLPEMMIPDAQGTRFCKTAVLIQSATASNNKKLQNVSVSFFVEIGGKARGPLFSFEFCVNCSAHISGNVVWMHSQRKKPWGGMQQISIMNSFLYGFIAVMEFLSCKNTKIYSDTVSDKMQNKAKKRFGRKIRSYTLNVIKPGITYVSVDAFGDKRNLPYHTVIGHIRRYTAEKPHVSGWVGPMYISPHVRGDRGNGEIRKDYKFTPKEPVLA